MTPDLSPRNFRIICGNCLVEMPKLESESVDLIFADPPYWMRTSGKLKRVEGTDYDGCQDSWDNNFASLKDYAEFTRRWLGECRRLLKKDGSLWVIGSMQCIYTIGNALQELGFWLVNDVVWWKNNPTPNMMGSRLCNAHETLIWAVKSEKSKFTFNYKTGKELNREAVSEAEYMRGLRKQLGSVWRFPVCSGNERIRNDKGEKLHSTQKPYALLYRIINLSSNWGDLVLDPFGGTFTTGAAALDSGRQFIGIDNSKQYCDYGLRRLRACVAKKGKIETAYFDIKPPKISLCEMIRRGFLLAGEYLYDRKGTAKCRLTPSGTLLLPNGQIADIHSGAAKVRNSKAERLNGFAVWSVKRDNSLVGIDIIRDRARAEISCADFQLRALPTFRSTSPSSSVS